MRRPLIVWAVANLVVACAAFSSADSDDDPTPVADAAEAEASAPVEAAAADDGEVDAEADAAPICEGRDADAGPETLLTDAGNVLGIAVDDTHVYLIAEGLGLRRIPKGGGAVQPIVPYAKIPDPPALTIDNASLYVANYSGNASGIQRISKLDAGVQVLDNCNSALGVAVDSTHAFWLTRCSTTDTRVRGGLKGAAPDQWTNLSTQIEAGRLVPHEDGVVALDATTVFWSDDRTVYSLARTANNATPFAVQTFPGLVRGLAVADKVYALTTAGISSVPKIGGLATPVANVVAGTIPGGLLERDGRLFVVDTSGKAILRMKTDGTDRRTLARDQEKPSLLALDACFVYWFVDDVNGSAIRRAPR
jgi:hypothetical protein